jgi:hypothetical protein
MDDFTISGIGNNKAVAAELKSIGCEELALQKWKMYFLI